MSNNPRRIERRNKIKSTNKVVDTAVIYELIEFPLALWIIRILLLLWTGFALSKFNINPVFFGLSIALAVGLIIRLSQTILHLTPTHILVYSKSFFGLKLSKSYAISNIENIHFKPSDFHYIALILDLFLPFPGILGYSRSKLSIKLKGEDWVAMNAVGSELKNKRLVRFVQKYQRQELNSRSSESGK